MTRPALPLACESQRLRPSYTRRTAPQTQPPRSGSRASRWAAQESPAGVGDSSGAIVRPCKQGLARPGPPTSFNPQDQSRKRIPQKKGPSAKPGPGSQDNLISCRRVHDNERPVPVPTHTGIPRIAGDGSASQARNPRIPNCFVGRTLLCTTILPGGTLLGTWER